MGRLVAFLLAAVLLHAAHAEFLVGEGRAGDRIFVLCEESGAAYVSLPSGATLPLEMDRHRQAYFVPDYPGPHSVQCGAQVKIVEVGASNAGEAARLGQDESAGALAIGAAAAMTLSFLLAAALLAHLVLFRRTAFVKSVEGGRAKLLLSAGKDMRAIRITDPVHMGFAGREMEFSIPRLAAGECWSWEYDVCSPKRALPASLRAECEGGRVSMLSQLMIDKEGKAAENRADWHGGCGRACESRMRRAGAGKGGIRTGEGGGKLRALPKAE